MDFLRRILALCTADSARPLLQGLFAEFLHLLVYSGYLNTTVEFSNNVLRSSTPEPSDRQTDKPKEQTKKRKHSDLSLDEPISKSKYKS